MKPGAFIKRNASNIRSLCFLENPVPFPKIMGMVKTVMPRALMLRALVLRALVLFSLLMGGAAWASDRERSTHLDTLFAQLKAAPNEQAAYEIEQKIWVAWTTPDDPELAELISQVLAARRTANYTKAFVILDDVVQRWSDYAEGWNQRAIIHFETGSLEQSLSDIAKTLEREPRHFGALAGRALIYRQQGNQPLTVESVLAAMEHHPYVGVRGLIPGLMQGDPLN